MKKIALAGFILIIALSSSAADIWGYAMQITIAPELPTNIGAGTGWYASLLNAADNSELASTSVVTNSGGNLFILGWTTPDIDEGLDVFYRIYNSTIAPSAPYWQIDSQTTKLQDLSAGFLPGANNVTLSFAGSTWQAVPEPTTHFLFIIGGIGAWIVRHKQTR
jgi:hypothetical protein